MEIEARALMGVLLMSGIPSVLARCGAGAALLVGITGCRGSSCTDTDLAVTSMTASSNTPLTLEATLMAGSRPVAGANISFYSKTVGGSSGEAGGRRTGSATTDDRGHARLSLSGLEDLEVLRGERAIAYKAEFKPLNRIGGTLYCSSSSSDAAIRRQ